MKTLNITFRWRVGRRWQCGHPSQADAIAAMPTGYGQLFRAPGEAACYDCLPIDAYTVETYAVPLPNVIDATNEIEIIKASGRGHSDAAALDYTFPYGLRGCIRVQHGVSEARTVAILEAFDL